MHSEPSLITILPFLAVPAVLAVLVLRIARRRGATWTQVQIAFAAAILGAFMTVTGWRFAAFLSGEPLSVWRILGSELLVASVCGTIAYFAAMPVDRDLTGEPRDADRHGPN